MTLPTILRAAGAVAYVAALAGCFTAQTWPQSVVFTLVGLVALALLLAPDSLARAIRRL